MFLCKLLSCFIIVQKSIQLKFKRGITKESLIQQKASTKKSSINYSIQEKSVEDFALIKKAVR